MMKTNAKQKGKITFGNILLTLLVLGVFVVIGLIATLYVQLTRTPQVTQENYRREQEQRANVECLSPTQKGSVNCDQQASQPHPAAGQPPSAKIPPQLAASQPDSLDAGGTIGELADDAAPKTARPKKTAPKTDKALPYDDGGVPLVAEEQKPRATPVRENRPSARPVDMDAPIQGERVLAPRTAPARRDNSDATNALFD